VNRRNLFTERDFFGGLFLCADDWIFIGLFEEQMIWGIAILAGLC